VPRELGVSDSTAHQRFTEWARAGVFERLPGELLRRLNQAGGIDWSTGVIDGSHVRGKRGVKPVIARGGEDHGSGLGAIRWVVERTFAWLHNFRRLRTRYERCAERHLAFLKLDCAVICQRLLA
jgi:transposase